MTINDQQIRMEIDNVSLGGVFCYCRNQYKSLLVQGLELNELELYFTFHNQCVNVTIQRAMIKRLESRHRPERCEKATGSTDLRTAKSLSAEPS